MKISSLARINFSIIMLCLTAIFFAELSGFLPDERIYQAENRTSLCGSLAINIGYCVSDHDLRRAGKQLEIFAAQNSDLISIGVRRQDGELAVAVGSHEETWREAETRHFDGCYIVPIEGGAGEMGADRISVSTLVHWHQSVL